MRDMVDPIGWVLAVYLYVRNRRDMAAVAEKFVPALRAEPEPMRSVQARHRHHRRRMRRLRRHEALRLAAASAPPSDWVFWE
jgi:hypothetical protein